jgi:hypothetical protein
VRAYEPLSRPLHVGPSTAPIERLDQRFALKRFSGDVNQRMNALFFNLANKGCDYGKQSQKNLYPMLKDVYHEAREIAYSVEDQRTAHAIAEFAANAAIAVRPDSSVDLARTEAFIREELQ